MCPAPRTQKLQECWDPAQGGKILTGGLSGSLCGPREVSSGVRGEAAPCQAVLWMLLGLGMLPFFFLFPHSIWEIFALYSDSWLFIAGWQVLGLEMKGKAGKEEAGWRDMVFLTFQSQSTSSLPASGTFLVFQEVLAGGALSSVVELAVREN